MRPLVGIVLFALACASTPAYALRHQLPQGARIGVLRPSVRGSHDAARVNAVAKYLSEELRHAGYDSHLVSASVDELRTGEVPSRDDYYIDVFLEDGYSGDLGGVSVGDGAVGAEVSVVTARMDVSMRVYDAQSFDIVREVNVSASSTRPALTGIGVGDRHGFFYLRVPLFTQGPYKVAAQAAAKDAVARITSQRESESEQ